MNTKEICEILQKNNKNIDIVQISSDTIDYMGDFKWGIGLVKKEYEKVERDFLNFEINKEKYRIYTLFDNSGYDYWVVNLEENNHLYFCIELKQELNKEEIKELDILLFQEYNTLTNK